ncbi:hypothetical protein HD806DRAFT_542610 [Xylariaceae sp. AK1471]|nr:hypothetical protein HD806DRAFT_542610 [Xylariaceae sp. AK1471]
MAITDAEKTQLLGFSKLDNKTALVALLTTLSARESCSAGNILVLATSEGGKSVLHYAALNSSEDVAKNCLDGNTFAAAEQDKRQDFINKKDDAGMTALHYCAKEDEPDILRLLVENGADPKLQTDEGKSVSEIAMLVSSDWVIRELTALNLWDY